jgi:hypothetical protein
MSSTLAHPPLLPFSQSARQALESHHHAPYPYTDRIKSWQSLVEQGTLGSFGLAGLPTPSEPRDMTEIGLNHYHARDKPAQAQGSDRLPCPAQPSANFVLYPPITSATLGHSQTSSTAPGKQVGPIAKDRSDSTSAIATYLQIPTSINSSKGSLAEFAAEVGLRSVVLCLFAAGLIFSR